MVWGIKINVIPFCLTKKNQFWSWIYLLYCDYGGEAFINPGAYKVAGQVKDIEVDKYLNLEAQKKSLPCSRSLHFYTILNIFFAV